MRNLALTGCVIISFLLFGCTKDDVTLKENEGDTMSGIDIYDFSFIKLAPESSKKQSLQDVIKIFFIENDSSLDTGYAVDIENNLVYVDPLIGSRGVRTGVEEPVPLHHAKDLIPILKEYNIQQWDKHYSQKNVGEYEDGYGWQCWLQYEDGTVESHSGSGIEVDKSTPDNFSAFKRALTEAIDEKLHTN